MPLRISQEQLDALKKKFEQNKAQQRMYFESRMNKPIWSDLSELKKIFQGKDVHILGSGPSLYGVDWEKFIGLNTICINNTIKWMKINPTIQVFLDMPVLTQGGTRDGVPIVTKIGNSVSRQNNEVYHIRLGRTLSDNPMNRGFYSAWSTGHVAIHLALYFECKNIYLWGLEKGFLNDEEFQRLSDHIQTCSWYKDKSILEAKDKLKSKGVTMGHFYTPWFVHPRDSKPQSYHSAGDKLAPFYSYDNIFQMTPVHFTKFKYKNPDEL